MVATSVLTYSRSRGDIRYDRRPVGATLVVVGIENGATLAGPGLPLRGANTSANSTRRRWCDEGQRQSWRAVAQPVAQDLGSQAETRSE